MDAPATLKPAARRFTLLDGMILICSIAVGLAAARWLDPTADWWSMLTELASNFAWDADLFDQVVPDLLMLWMPSAVTLTLGTLALRLRKPRPRWRGLARQPGVVAGLALVLGWVVSQAFSVVSMSWSPILTVTGNRSPISQEVYVWALTFTLVGSALGGFAVVVAWATQLLVGRWRAEPTWPDRLGRLVGLGWIMMGLVGAFVLRTMPI